MIEQQVFLITHHGKQKWFAMDNQDNAERYLKKCLLDRSFDTVYGIANILVNPEEPLEFTVLKGTLLGIFEEIYLEVNDRRIDRADYHFLCRFTLSTRRFSDLSNPWIDDYRAQQAKIETNDPSPRFFEEVEAARGKTDASHTTYLIQDIKARILAASRDGHPGIGYEITEFPDVEEIEALYHYLMERDYRSDLLAANIKKALGREFSVKVDRIAKRFTAEKDHRVYVFMIFINW